MTIIISAALLIVLTAFDQFTKALAASTNVNCDFFWFIRFDYLENPGMAFGIFSSNSTAMVFVTIFTVIMIIGLAVVYFTVFRKNTPIRYAIAVIEAGAVGNLIDRVWLHYVRDFIDVSAIGFGTCNIADFCVTFGAAAFIFILLFIGKDALFPLTKKWREEAKEQELLEHQAREEKKRLKEAALAGGTPAEEAQAVEAKTDETQTEETNETSQTDKTDETDGVK